MLAPAAPTAIVSTSPCATESRHDTYAPPPPLNAGFAYRVRDSDVNVSGGFSQGRGQPQVSAVDDDTLMEGDPALVTAPSHGHVGGSVVL